ncbi:RNA methyltransferase tRNA(m5U54)methyltransferase [Serendipita sp. 399]|nr:RNA methyltransferase tRNA(m5U54)methyltransferase [Serendipita sp. 399]
MSSSVSHSTDPIAITVPKGFKLHTENSAHILLPDTNDAFLNPIQEFNRDLSVACIRVWAEEKEEQRRQKRLLRKQKEEAKGNTSKRQKCVCEMSKITENRLKVPIVNEDGEDAGKDPTATEDKYTGIVILEALSATGLRSIRYAKEIPQVNYVLANDLSEAACEAMRRNVDINGLGSSDAASTTSPKVRVNEGDACTLMYAHRPAKDRVDVVDLDPYGTAAPFLDAAVQCVRDDGLLCVTCTDLSVLASGNYPEKCFANYGGVPVRGEYCHESSMKALRLVLSSIATAASRYGRSITPLLSLSIDFYVRLFVRVKTSPIEVKKLLSQLATYYICTTCQSYYEQPLGRAVEQPSKKGEPNINYKTHAGPPVSQRCPECDGTLHLAGPMWKGAIHDPVFAKQVATHVEADPSKYGTSARMKGMLTVASEELPVPFYFTPSKIAGYFRCEVPPLMETTRVAVQSSLSALLNSGYSVSRSHAVSGSIKTTAPRSFINDVMREWIKEHPVKMENISEGHVARRLLLKPQRAEISFEKHAKAITREDVKLVRYQVNPTPNWGPKPRAKRKRDTPEDDANMGES